MGGHPEGFPVVIRIGSRIDISKAMAVLVPIEEWERQETLLDGFEDMALGLIVSDRVPEASPWDSIPLVTVMKRFGPKP